MGFESEFFESPTSVFVNNCKKDQLVVIADHYGIDVAGQSRKEENRKATLLSMFEQGIQHKSEHGAESVPVSAPAVGLTGYMFKQQKNLLALQFE